MYIHPGSDVILFLVRVGVRVRVFQPCVCGVFF
jgi:hypothetical protein